MRHVTIYFMISLLCGPAFGADVMNASIRTHYDSNVISDIIYCNFTDRYDSALKLCDQIVASQPQDPSGYFFRAYTLMTAMTEEQSNLHEADFLRCLDSVEVLATAIMDTCQFRSKAWCQWYLGNVWAHRSLWEARFGSGTAAYKLSKKARDHYEKSLAIDSTLYDNYAGLGAVHYWKSAKGGLFRSLGFISDERRDGIAELKLAAERALLSRETTKKTLITILRDNKQYDSAIAYAEDMLARYPDGRSFLWGIAWCYYDKQEYDRAIDYFKRLRGILTDSPGNYHKLIECDAQITRCLDELKRDKEARGWAARADDYIPFVPDAVRENQKENIKYLVSLCGE